LKPKQTKSKVGIGFEFSPDSPVPQNPDAFWVEKIVLSFQRFDNLGLGSLGLGLLSLLAADADALKDGLAVLVELELGNDHVGGVDAEGDGLAGGLVAGDALDVDDVLEAVHRGDLALLVLVEATDDGDLVILADGDGADLKQNCESTVPDQKSPRKLLTLYFSRSSLERGALMITRRSLEGALKCALRDLRREEWRAANATLLI